MIPARRPPRRAVIVNADDFGRSPGINRGIVQSHERGIVTSASLMVCWPAAVEAAAYARSHPEVSVGLHVDLREWSCTDGEWRLDYERVDCGDAAAVDREMRAQLDRFRALVGSDPTHLDSHQHVHRIEPIRSAAIRLAEEIGVPLRHCSPHVRYVGDFYGQTATGRPIAGGVSVANLRDLLRRVPVGVTELGCHPGYADDLETMYRAERRQEIRALCSAAARRALAQEQLALVSFAELAVGAAA